MRDHNLEALLLPFFEDLHRHPELGTRECRTTGRVADALKAAGIAFSGEGLNTGVVATIPGSAPGPVAALRCDLDALPIQEQTDLPYASCTPGVMHACGHDFHTAAALGAALILREQSFPGTVKVIFQPSEEVGDGALQVIRSGLAADADAFFALHTTPDFPPGTLGIREGPVMAAVDRFEVTLHGRGGHAAHPHRTVDPIVAAAALIQGCQTLISRRLDPFASAVITFARMDAGTAWNVIPESAHLEGTMRTLDAEKRAMLQRDFNSMSEQLAQAYGARAEVLWEKGSPALVNDEALCAMAREVAAAAGFRVVRQDCSMGAEDFSEYLTGGKPGVFVRVGTGGGVPAHHPQFRVDPAALVPAAQFMAALITAWLKKEATHA